MLLWAARLCAGERNSGEITNPRKNWLNSVVTSPVWLGLCVSKPVLASRWRTGCGNLLQFQLGWSEPLGFVLWSALSGQQSQKALESGTGVCASCFLSQWKSFRNKLFGAVLLLHLGVQVCRGINNNTWCQLEGLCFCYSTNVNYRWMRKSTQTPLNSGLSADFVLTAQQNLQNLHSCLSFSQLCFVFHPGRGMWHKMRDASLQLCPFLIYSFSLLHTTVTKNGNYGITLCSHLQGAKGWGCFWHRHKWNQKSCVRSQRHESGLRKTWLLKDMQQHSDLIYSRKWGLRTQKISSFSIL